MYVLLVAFYIHVHVHVHVLTVHVQVHVHVNGRSSYIRHPDTACCCCVLIFKIMFPLRSIALLPGLQGSGFVSGGEDGTLRVWKGVY